MGYSADKSPLIGHLAGPIRRLKPLGAQRQEKGGPNHLTREGLHATTPEFLASHRESTALGVGQAKWTWATLLPEDPILLPEIIDHVFLVAVHPASGREYEEAQSVGHSLRLLGEQPLAPTLFRRFANLGRFVAPYAVGEAGHGVAPAPVDGEGAHAVEGRGLAIDGAGGRPGGAPGELVLADLIGGQRSGPRGAAEERGEMGDPAAGGGAGFQPPLRASSDSCNNAPAKRRVSLTTYAWGPL